MDSLHLAIENLTSPPVLAFVLGALAVALRSDLRLPDPIHTWLATYLLLAIGLKGGHALRGVSVGEVLAPAGATVALGVVMAAPGYPLDPRKGDAVPSTKGVLGG